VIGLGDRALEGKVRVPWGWHITALTPRVITLQNRLRLTQLPRRAPYKSRVFAEFGALQFHAPLLLFQYTTRHFELHRG